MIGKTLGHYQITSQLGKGGMGEVYQAKDSKLGRDVAIKVLPEEFAKDADRIARFQREAKLLASLNHPNIAAIYGLEESGGTNFLVMELVEGETLAERIPGSAGVLAGMGAAEQTAIQETLKLALQIAEALEAAHEKGVIHRDLKPANIKVTRDGKVKVLDFGLAKAFAGEQAEMNLSASPTLSHLATQQGIILGTAAYMSPEQAKGKPVDKRADIWAFGCVLYEMLTGRAAFQGDDVTEILAAVVKGGANLDLLPANIHPRVRETITRCLLKDLKKRYQDIGDVRYELEQAVANPSITESAAGTAVQSKWRLVIPWVAAAIVLTAILAAVVVWRLNPSEPHPVTRLSHVLSKDQQVEGMGGSIAVSRDGRRFAYRTSTGLWLRSMNEMGARLLLGSSEGAPRWPFFSPDGKWIGFYSGTRGKLEKISISGGVPVQIADVVNNGWFKWEADDTIVYGQAGKGVMRVSANGGTPEPIVKVAENETFINPQVLPDGKSILVTRIFPRPAKTFVLSHTSGKRKELFDGSDARYLPSGHIVYAFVNNLFAARFDLSALSVVGGAVSLPESVYSGSPPQYDVSDSGTLVYIPATNSVSPTPRNSLVWVDRSGKEEPIEAESKSVLEARISPDGTKAALSVFAEGNIGIWILEFDRRTMTPLTLDRAFSPLWTPDSKRIVFASYREGPTRIYRAAADGTGKVEPIGKEELISSPSGSRILPSAWSKDGKILVLMEAAGESSSIGALFMEGKSKYKQMLRENYHFIQPRISPDGRWIAYTSNQSGRNEVYVRPFPDVESGGRRQVSATGGDNPLWSPNTPELFYHNANEIMAVRVKTEPNLDLGTPKLLFRGTYNFSNLSAINQMNRYPARWDVSLDGRHFLMIKPPVVTSIDAGPRQIDIILNWLEELTERVPVK